MKTFKFQVKHVKPILKGIKTTTWRLFGDGDVEAGDHVEFINQKINKRFVIAHIISVEDKTFADINVKDWEGHGEFKDDKEMFKIYKDVYKREVDKNTQIKVIKFEL